METQNRPSPISVNLFLDPKAPIEGVYEFTVIANISHSDHGQMAECAVLVRKAVESAVKAIPSCCKVRFQKTIVKTSDHTYEMNDSSDWKVESPLYIGSEVISAITLKYTLYCTSKEGVADTTMEEFTKHNLPTFIW